MMLQVTCNSEAEEKKINSGSVQCLQLQLFRRRDRHDDVMGNVELWTVQRDSSIIMFI